MKHLLFAILVFTFFSVVPRHVRCQTGNGTTIFEFLRLDHSARTAALGGNMVATSEADVNSFFQNPATISDLLDRQASFSFQKNLLDINSGFAAYGRTFKGIGTFVGGVSYVNYGSFDGYDAVGNSTSSFSAGDLALQVGYAREIYPSLNAGATVKFIFSGIAGYHSSAAAVDLGLFYSLVEEQATIGLSILNLGTQITTYNGTSESLPTDIRIGATKRLEGLPLTVNLGFSQLGDTYNKFFDRFKTVSFGGEFVITDNILLRLGYNNQQREDLSASSSVGLSGISAGLGVHVSGFKLDYAVSSWGVIGMLHQFTVSTKL
jgi:hypothetical protein